MGPSLCSGSRAMGESGARSGERLYIGEHHAFNFSALLLVTDKPPI